jgi:hypothetical protein
MVPVHWHPIRTNTIYRHLFILLFKGVKNFPDFFSRISCTYVVYFLKARKPHLKNQTSLMFSFFKKSYHPLPWRDSITRPITPVSSVAWPRRLRSLGANFNHQWRSCPPGVKLIPYEWSYPLGRKLSVRPSTRLNSIECSLLWVNEGVNIPPRGQSSPLRVMFAPGGQGWS